MKGKYCGVVDIEKEMKAAEKTQSLGKSERHKFRAY
jgi:hypothetical protein